MHGYNGALLVIDVSKQSWSWKELDQGILRQFLGGTGLAAYLLYKYCPAGIDAFDAKNPLVFCSSPLVGTKLTTSSKFAVATKSPLTGFIGDSLSSSHLAVSIKEVGADAVILTGISKEWVTINVTDEGVSFESGTELLGKSTSETEAALKEELSDTHRIACIGPAGENLVRFASISNDGGRQAGRTGAGAVMGSKRVKAISFIGRKTMEVSDPNAILKIRGEMAKKSLGFATEKYRNMGTMANISIFNRLKVLPTANFKEGSHEYAENISGESLHLEENVSSAHCANCTIGCEKLIKIPGESGKSVRMEYQSLYAMGPLVNLVDRKQVLENSKLCDELGMDTISAGATIAWYLEATERNLIPPLTDNFGSHNRVDELSVNHILDSIAHREGVGDLLAEGCMRASEKIGGGTDSFAMHVKGLEMPGYEPRNLKTMGLALAVSTRGACHNRSSAYEHDFSDQIDEGSGYDIYGELVKESEDYSAVMDSLIWCKFVRKVFVDFYQESVEILNHVTGWDVTEPELRMCGERINNVKKMFNVREGWFRDHDTLPARILNEPIIGQKGEEIRLNKADLDTMIASYYEARGWSPSGVIPEDKIQELEIRL